MDYYCEKVDQFEKLEVIVAELKSILVDRNVDQFYEIVDLDEDVSPDNVLLEFPIHRFLMVQIFEELVRVHFFDVDRNLDKKLAIRVDVFQHFVEVDFKMNAYKLNLVDKIDTDQFVVDFVDTIVIDHISLFT